MAFNSVTALRRMMLVRPTANWLLIGKTAISVKFNDFDDFLIIGICTSARIRVQRTTKS
jgi:hypothetical protein